ncbi:D-xylulose reductase [Phyllobacterium trifolii]|uniref:D-xylulose reductase n=1 Tax=Phyllobacterium trifolii TaxID=300193 RepID=A0A839UF15_9HYPH|nr:NAD(P)-dependent alcohol dehydrogenase [Phyllobacterium trifolii]MBB3149606.1 D-xylulose reductase [Phyllobacterium trifolii]
MNRITIANKNPSLKVPALVLEGVRQLALRDIELPLGVGHGQVKIAIHTVGICGSDVHYYTHGKIGPFVVHEPMVLGHEAAGTIVEVGAGVTHLHAGDRVCMEPGIPDPFSRAARLGIYNVDPSVRFWATPPVHGCLTPHVVHPAQYTYRLPDNVSFAEGAMVEPLAVGLQAVEKAAIMAGDTGVVIGAGPIGLMTALAALAGGCSRVVVADLQTGKLDVAAKFDGLIPVNVRETPLKAVIQELTGGWGADVVFEASGSVKAYEGLGDLLRPRGKAILIGMPVEPVAFDVSALMTKELRLETVFRYAHQYDRAMTMLGAGQINLNPLVSETFAFKDSVRAFERAAEGRPQDVKLQIRVAG